MSDYSQPSGLELFKKIITLWRRRSDPTEALTLTQIANIALGSGTPKNASTVGRTLNEFIEYFDAPFGYGKKWKVKWAQVEKDYQALCSPTTKPQPKVVNIIPVNITPTNISPLEGMNVALNDEYEAVCREMRENPIIAPNGITDVGTAGEGSFLYKTIIEIAGDGELPIPEGVGIRLEWGGFLGSLDATLLNYDSLESSIIFEVAKPLTFQHKSQKFKIFPQLEELIRTVQSKLSELKTKQKALSWRILQGNLSPQINAWNIPSDRRGLDDAQFNTIKRCLEQDITFVWGPPGTGKTYTLARLIATAALQGKRVIAASIANVAVDQLALQLVRALKDLGKEGNELLDTGRVVRFGHPRLPEINNESRLFPNKQEMKRILKELNEVNQRRQKILPRDSVALALNQKDINRLNNERRGLTKKVIEQAQILLTTSIQVCLETAISETPFHLMVVDEAGMMPVPHLACMGLFGQEKLVIAGDFRQLGPIAVSRTQAAYDWLHKDAFELAGITQNLSHPNLSMLTTQRRMHNDICELINQPFYAGKLRSETQKEKTLACKLHPLPGKSAVMVLFTSEDGSRVEQTEAGSRQNTASAKLVTKLAKHFAITYAGIQIGIIAPYRAQASLIKRLLKEADLPRQLMDQFKIGTIHAFQGSEADVIIWDIVDTKEYKIGKPYQGDTGNRLANVAISRAQGKLVIIGDPDAFVHASNAPTVKQLKGLLVSRFSSEKGNLTTVKNLRAFL